MKPLRCMHMTKQLSKHERFQMLSKCMYLGKQEDYASRPATNSLRAKNGISLIILRMNFYADNKSVNGRYFGILRQNTVNIAS